MRATLHAIKAKLRPRMHEPVNAVGAWLKRVVSGYYRYHAVPENQRALGRFRNRLCDLWRSMLGCSVGLSRMYHAQLTTQPTRVRDR
jgi:RNA-directed DNA polymerase